jgi:cell division protease FtsH
MNNKINRPIEQKGMLWRYIVWFVLVWLFMFYLFRLFSPEFVFQKIPYSRFKTKVRQKQIAEITIKGDEITGRLNETKNNGKRPRTVQFKTVKPAVQDPELLPLLEKSSVVVNAVSQQTSLFWRLVINLLPWLLLIGFFVYSSKKFQERMGGGKEGIFGFGKSKAKVYKHTGVEVKYNDVAGLENAKKELKEIVDYLKDPAKFEALGGQLPKGVLLVGPPGVGKTLLAQAVAGEAGVPFYSISGSEFIEMFVGVGASRVRDMFKKAKKDAPTIIFIDEIDSIGRVRGTGLGGGHDEREQTLNQILSEMDGFSPSASVVVIAATNRPDVLDPALIRPGRFDRRITLDLPQKKARKEILETHSQNVPLSDDVDFEKIAEMSTGFSGADLRNLVNEAALLAARKDKKQVTAEDFEQARDKIMMGIEREDVIGDAEKKLIAYHETGHALTAIILPNADPLQKVTIIPRGKALGATEQIPEEDRHNFKKSYLVDRIAVILGGRAAEKIAFDDVSTGAGDDLKQGTRIARRMVCQWGMSETLAPVTFKQGDPHPFLGKELSEPRDFSEHTARLIDEEIQKIVRDAETKALEVLSDNREKLEILSKRLLDQETLNREEIDKILAAAKT